MAMRAYEPLDAVISVQPEGDAPPTAVRAGTVDAVCDVNKPINSVVSTVPALKAMPNR
jgi:hypothetical protein